MMMNIEVKRRVNADQVRRKRALEDRLARRTRSIFAGIRADLVEAFPALDALPALRPHQNSLQAELEAHYRLVQREFESDLPRQLGGSLPDGALPVIGAGLAAWITRRSTFQADVIITTVRKRRDRAVSVARNTLQQQAPGDLPSPYRDRQDRSERHGAGHAPAGEHRRSDRDARCRPKARS